MTQVLKGPKPPEPETPQALSLDGYFWAINERSELGIPAVELDMDTGNQLVLVFTSKESAQKFCYVRNPPAVANIYQLSRRVSKDKEGKNSILQTGLVRIARRIKTARLDHITHFVVDHPGTKGRAAYLSVEDMAFFGRKQVPANISSVKELSSFLDEVED